MTRWLCARGIAVVLAYGTFTAAQSPAPAPREGDIVTFRTSGQPERKVKVLRVAPFHDGESLADVQDVATGAKYTIPGKVLTAPARGAARVPERVSATPPAVSHHADTNGWPKKPASLSHARPAGSPTSVPPPPLARGMSPPSEQRSPTPEPGMPRIAPIPELPPTVPAPQPLPVSVQPPPTTQPTDLLASPAPVTIVPIGLAGAAAEQMIQETTPLLRDLTQELRPTVREIAATSLAEGRYGWRSEVKAELARSAAHDPAPAVRAHCIRLLSKLGYHETAYLDQLAAWAASDSIRVREAAREALAKLGPRN